ncbi:MAG TPA: hypothetical protein DD381_08380, partial [Lentisphaeria bacterium]|nr:hypothetical protein [Lentisphaeria bacterium]
MMKIITLSVCFFGFLALANLNADINVNLHNDTGQDVYAYLDYQPPTTIITKNLLIDGKFHKIMKGETYKFVTSYINSGNLFFAIPGSESKSFIYEGGKTQPPANGDAFSGFIEFSYVQGSPVYWDASNVDSVGMLYGVQLTDLDQDYSPKFGYKYPQADFINNLIEYCQFTQSEQKDAYKSFTIDRQKFSKLLGSTVCPQAYSSKYSEYLKALRENIIEVTFYSDDMSNDKVHIKNNPYILWPNTAFNGSFYDAATVDGINNVILKLTSQDESTMTTIYLTTDALNGNTVVQSNSSKGMYVRGPEGCNDKDANNVSLNWTGKTPATTTQFQAWVDSVTRGLLCDLNLGLIPVAPKDDHYDQNNQKTWDKSGKYANRYNQYIVNNSNSYGMAYSDAAHSKVQFVTTGNVLADVYLFS